MEPRRTKNNPDKGFRCLSCYEMHSSKTAAQKCCTEIEAVYTCPDCGEEHDKKSDAQYCCSMWECTFCGEEYTSAVDANKCCQDK